MNIGMARGGLEPINPETAIVTKSTTSTTDLVTV